MANINFWVIFDTCTRPEYYQDVHNLLALPKGSIITYNYNKKYCDDLSLDYAKLGEYPKTVLLIYNQFEEYKRGETHEVFKGLIKAKGKSFYIPTRFATIKSIQFIHDEIYFDLEVDSYPYIGNETTIKSITDSLNNSVPFATPSKYVAISSRNDDLSIIKNSKTDKDNWSAIVSKFRDHKNQFSNDSFWRVEGPYSNNKLIEPSYSYNIDESGQNVNYQSHYNIKEGLEFYFLLYNYEPISTIKAEIYREAIEKNINLDSVIRRIQIKDTFSPFICFIKKLELRQYFITKIKFQKNYNRDLYTKEGACYLSTSGQSDEWPIGANIYFYFKLKKRWLHIILGILLILLSVFFTLYSSQVIDCYLTKGIILGLCATASILAASVLLYKQIATKI